MKVEVVRIDASTDIHRTMLEANAKCAEGIDILFETKTEEDDERIRQWHRDRGMPVQVNDAAWG